MTDRARYAIHGIPNDTLTSDVINERRFKVETSNSTTAYGALSVESLTPIIQITAQYGLRDDVLTAVVDSGTAGTVDSKYHITSGTGANSVATIVSAREATYRPGQGLTTRFSAIFTPGVANQNQYAGFITSESAFAFGYNGTEFGITRSVNGILEQQELQITTSGSGDVSITIDGNAYTVTLTAGTVQHNAYEIAVSLDSQVPGYGMSSTDDVVVCLAQLPDFGGGAFTYTPLASGSAGTFTQIQSGTIMTDNWVPKAQWNVRPDIDIDPSLGNIYEIQVKYLGFGGIRFYVENPETALFELVHILKYANTSTVPIVKNPIFRMGWALRNKGNTTDISVEGASAGVFVEGGIHTDGRKRGFCTDTLGVGTTRTNILALKNRTTFNATANRAEILPSILNAATDTGKTAVFEIILNPVVLAGESLNFQSQGTTELAEIATDDVTIIGGQVLTCFNVKSGAPLTIQLDEIIEDLLPGEVIAITAHVTQTPTSEMDVAINWQDDL
tara:strand:- start:50 stop:1558 length:1509 start_codon:yes stop_codon:yes gene_type:complete